MTTISLNKKIKIISNKDHYISKNIFQLKVLVFEENNMLNEEFYKIIRGPLRNHIIDPILDLYVI